MLLYSGITKPTAILIVRYVKIKEEIHIKRGEKARRATLYIADMLMDVISSSSSIQHEEMIVVP